MSLRFYMDHQIRAAITDGLRRRGIDVLTRISHQLSTARPEVQPWLRRAARFILNVFTNTPTDESLALLATTELTTSRDDVGEKYGLTAYEDGAAELGDERILERAAEAGRIVFTHDDDFLALVDRWRQAGRSFAGLV